jgi:hypothetical protein
MDIFMSQYAINIKNDMHFQEGIFMIGKLPVRLSGKYMDVYEYLCLTFSTTDNYIDRQLKLSLIFIFTNNADGDSEKDNSPA